VRSLVSAHLLSGVEEGQFVSLLDPPSALRQLTDACRNQGVFPVLVGEEGHRDTMLASPIILYDYPQIAPESAGDLFDGTEIDEILSLRILTMTDAEKREMSLSDERARQMLERTEALPAEQFAKLHGTLRSLRPAQKETP
jgi:hydrogenase maturation protease